MLTQEWLASTFKRLSNWSPSATRSGQKWVYFATHDTYGDIVLKVIQPGQDARRVERELLAVQAIDTPRVPAVLETGLAEHGAEELVWIIEARVTGQDLRQLLKVRRLTPLECYTMTAQVLEALRAGEAKRIVHRDVKPDNLILDNSGDTWLLDYGISRHLDMESATPSASAFGLFTPGYAPREQFRNIKSDIDHRVDLFALGVTVYEGATQSNPFRDGARDRFEILRRVETQALPPIPRTDLEQGFLDLVYTMTRPRRDHRPESASAALEWLRELPLEQSTD